MAAADCGSRRRFAVACGVLSQRVKSEVAGKMAAAAAAHPEAPAEASTTMLLMPGADVLPDVGEEIEATPQVGAAALGQAQLTIMYGGRVLVFDDFPADRAADLVRAAGAGQDVSRGGCRGLADLPVARKASLQLFMEKRRGRIGSRAPYARRPSPSSATSRSAKDTQQCLLGL